jgi:exodeoxyribonuclease V alpha subunit
MSTLHPHGAARVAAGFGTDPALPPPLPDAVREALSRAELGEEEAHFAWELARAAGAGEHHLAVVAIALVTQDALSRGSTRVPRDPAWLSEQARALGFPPEVLAAIPAALASPLFGAPGERRPMVLDGAHLYQERLLALEVGLCRLLAARLARPSDVPPRIASALESIATLGGVTLTDEQLGAVRAALSSPLCVVSGGPGTGKTSVVVAILRAALESGLMDAPSAIGLAAPTGKAADRLRRSIARDPELAASLPSPGTLHRLLGYSPSRGAFHHHRGNPLAQRLVIVDESSMIDVFLMERLVASLREDAHLVLLGDAEQLPSVAAGAVFRDLGRASAVRSVVLTRSHRMDPRRPDGLEIGTAAAAVNRGEMPRARSLHALPDRLDDLSGIALFEPDGPLGRERFLELWLEHVALDRSVEDTWPTAEGRISDAAALEPFFAHLERSRLLCITRSPLRPTGADAINASLHRRRAAQRRSGAGLLFAGEPVLVHTNDYERGLWNGDQGMILWTQSAGEAPRASAVFRQDAGFVAHPLESVRAAIELGYATTVHKAQGSEHERVALLLPETDSPRLLAREIVYTAITRARRSVLIVGSAELLARAAARKIERETGIAERLEHL